MNVFCGVYNEKKAEYFSLQFLFFDHLFSINKCILTMNIYNGSGMKFSVTESEIQLFYPSGHNYSTRVF